MSKKTQYKFRLYVAGDALNSVQPRANLMTPTLVQLAPLPERTLVGTLSQTQLVLRALGLSGVSA